MDGWFDDIQNVHGLLFIFIGLLLLVYIIMTLLINFFRIVMWTIITLLFLFSVYKLYKYFISIPFIKQKIEKGRQDAERRNYFNKVTMKNPDYLDYLDNLNKGVKGVKQDQQKKKKQKQKQKRLEIEKQRKKNEQLKTEQERRKKQLAIEQKIREKQKLQKKRENKILINMGAQMKDLNFLQGNTEQVNTEKKGQSSSWLSKIFNFSRKTNQQPKSNVENQNTKDDTKQTGNGVTFMPISEESIYNNDLQKYYPEYSQGVNQTDLDDPYAFPKENPNSPYYLKNTDTILQSR